MTISKVSSKGWVVIPAPIRKKYGIQSGDQVVIESRLDGVLVKSAVNILHRYRGIAKKGPGTKDLMRERRKELKPGIGHGP